MQLGARTDYDIRGGRCKRRSVLVKCVGSSGLSDNSEDHGELVGDETSTPEIVLGIEHVAVLEGGEPDAVQVETPDNHVGVVAVEGRAGGWEEDKERGELRGTWIGRLDYKYGARRVWVIMSAPGAKLLN